MYPEAGTGLLAKETLRVTRCGAIGMAQACRIRFAIRLMAGAQGVAFFRRGAGRAIRYRTVSTAERTATGFSANDVFQLQAGEQAFGAKLVYFECQFFHLSFFMVK